MELKPPELVRLEQLHKKTQSVEELVEYLFLDLQSIRETYNQLDSESSKKEFIHMVSSKKSFKSIEFLSSFPKDSNPIKKNQSLLGPIDSKEKQSSIHLDLQRFLVDKESQKVRPKKQAVDLNMYTIKGNVKVENPKDKEIFDEFLSLEGVLIRNFFSAQLGDQIKNQIEMNFIARFASMLISFLYTKDSLIRKDGNYAFSHHLFIFEYLKELYSKHLSNKEIYGPQFDFEVVCEILGHDYLEDISKIIVKTKRNEISKKNDGTKTLSILEEPKRLVSHSKKVKLTKDMLDHKIKRPVAESISQGIAALSRIREEEYQDYIDTLILYMCLKEHFGPNLDKINEKIDSIIIKNDYLSKGIESYIAQNISISTDYKLFIIKMADRIHNTLTVEGFLNAYNKSLDKQKNQTLQSSCTNTTLPKAPIEKMIEEISQKSLYMIHISKLLLLYGSRTLTKEIHKKIKPLEYPKQYKHLSVGSFIKSVKTLKGIYSKISSYENILNDIDFFIEKKHLINSIKSLKILYQEFLDLSYVSIEKSKQIRSLLNNKDTLYEKYLQFLDTIDNTIKKYNEEINYFNPSLFEGENRARALINSQKTL
ncbi:MAG TPA: hypothetical protein PLX15_04500 [Candidatus Woesearchaeota archaeon]|nr:hypothetical protein [Candidatus Woesearchaeota archaeon]